MSTEPEIRIPPWYQDGKDVLAIKHAQASKGASVMSLIPQTDELPSLEQIVEIIAPGNCEQIKVKDPKGEFIHEEFELPDELDVVTDHLRGLASTLKRLTQCKTVVLTTPSVGGTQHYKHVGCISTKTQVEGRTEARALTNPSKTLAESANNHHNRVARSKGETAIEYYYGCPLRTADGDKIGTLCCVDDAPTALDDRQMSAIRVIAKFCIAQLELCRYFQKVDESSESKRASLLRSVQENVSGFQPLLPSQNPILNRYLDDVSSSHDMQRILSDTEDCALVISQLGREQSLEVVMFWHMCELYRARPCATFLLAAVETFIKTDAVFEINANQREREPVLQVYKEVCSLLEERTATAIRDADALCTVHILDKMQTKVFIALQDKSIEIPAEPDPSNPVRITKWVKNKIRRRRKKSKRK